MARKAARIRCPECGKTVASTRLDWNEITEEVADELSSSGIWVDEDAWDEEFWDEVLAETPEEERHIWRAKRREAQEERRVWRAEHRRAQKEFAMGPHYWNADRPIHYYRRVRRCSNCAHVFATAEVDEDLLNEVDEFAI